MKEDETNSLAYTFCCEKMGTITSPFSKLTFVYEQGMVPAAALFLFINEFRNAVAACSRNQTELDFRWDGAK